MHFVAFHFVYIFIFAFRVRWRKTAQKDIKMISRYAKI